MDDISFSSTTLRTFANLKINFLTKYSRRLERFKICFLVLLSYKFVDHFNSLIVYFTDQKYTNEPKPIKKPM